MIAMKTRFAAVLFLLSLAAQIVGAQNNNYLFAYFKNNGEDGLHFAFSNDGLKWQTLNDDKSFLAPLVGSQKLMRDPCILRGADGTFHLVWTTGWRGTDIGIAHSKDLIHWSEQKAIPVMAHEPTAMNAWAPEIIYDEAKKQYVIFWATTIPGRFPATEKSGNNGLNHRIYFTTTKDFESYSKAEVFYDDGFNVIDATILKHGKQYVMIVKDETQNPVKKNLRIATSNKAAGAYSKASAPFTMDWVEGPTALQVNGEWIVYYDMYRDKKYGALKTRNFKTWENISDQISLPSGIRHGTAFAVSAEVLKNLEAVSQQPRISWRQAQQQSAAWYSTPEAIRIAENLLLYQKDNGGWDKNIEMAKELAPGERAELLEDKDAAYATIDNGATYSQMIYLARVFNVTHQEKYQSAFIKGLDYLLAAQYANGGWPQYFPLRKGYYKHITYNDDAMINVMSLLRDITREKSLYQFVDESRRTKCAQAVAKGIECILQTQISVNGKKTAWCAQHDEITLAPASARAYEKISLSGSESIGIVRFLLATENPSPQIIEAVKAATDWLAQAKISGIKIVQKPDPTAPKGFDRIVVQDEKAEPLWARFYEIGTNRPIFCGRDSIIKYSLAEIEYERRNGYNWYTNAPQKLLTVDFPAWQKRGAK